MLLEVGQVHKCPTTITDTGFLKIVSDGRRAPGNPLQPNARNYELLVVEYDPVDEKTVGPAFEATAQEILKWRKTK